MLKMTKPLQLWLPVLVSLASQLYAQSFNPNSATAQEFDLSKVGTNKTTNSTYSNPIFTRNIGDPWMTRYSTSESGDWYLFTYSTNDNITLQRSQSLTDNWDYAEERTVFQPNQSSGEPWSTDIWAPEIHNISGTWYIIFTATPDRDQPHPLVDAQCPFECPAINHRMFVLEGDGPDPWTANFTMKGMLDTYDQFAIDGTYFVHNTNLYHIYSCWETATSAWPAHLCITTMSNPYTISTPLTSRTILSSPTLSWEQVPAGRPIRLATNEGPQQLTNPLTSQQYVIYSAARVNTPYYCLGMLELLNANSTDPSVLASVDPMNPSHWRKWEAGCLFQQNPAEGVYGPGHASFTTSPDGNENYIVYHAQTTSNPSTDLYRTARTQRFVFDEHDGRPVFPAAANGPFPVPGGQQQ